MFRSSRKIPNDAVVEFMFSEYQKEITEELAGELSELFTNVIRLFRTDKTFEKMKIAGPDCEETSLMSHLGAMKLASRFFHFQLEKLSLVEEPYDEFE